MKKTPETPPIPQPEPVDPVNRHVKVLVCILGIWAILFLVVIIEKAAEVRMVLPVVGLAFFVYLIYATISVLSNRK